jgi:hypothetical protein
MAKYKWDAIPTEYNWVAKDSDGTIEAYSERPILREYDWHSSGLGSTAVLGYSRSWESDDDWEDSLEERPKVSRYRLYHTPWVHSGITDTITNHYLTLGEVLDLLNERSES